MGLQTEIKEAPINEYAMASISYEQGDWAYEADVIEGKLNSLTLYYRPLKLASGARSEAYPLEELTTELVVGNSKSNVSCVLR
jgi:hypothetical protein